MLNSLRRLSKMSKYSIVKVLNNLFWKFDQTIYVEGGFGNQLLGMMQLIHYQKLDASISGDFRYFYSKPPGKETQLLAWELKEYGIDLPSQSEKMNSKIARWKYLIRPRNSQVSNSTVKFWRDFDPSHFREDFPLHKNTAALLMRLNISEGDRICSIHLRRGDYLQVSSRVVQTHELGPLTGMLKSLSISKFVVFSDSFIPLVELEKLESQLGVKCIFVQGGDLHAVHGVMRMSDILIASNSTFSLTAGLLSEKNDSFLISPTHFFSPDQKNLNELFQSKSNWMII